MRAGLFIGVMSGTSLDGVDVVLATINERHVVHQASYSQPIPVEIKQSVLDICQGQALTLSQLGQLETRLGILFADAVMALMAQERLSAPDVVAVGCHGQTVWHQPDGPWPNTLQIGDNNQIAVRTGVTVVGDFRRRDMALGGQGAPLVSAFHQEMLGDAVQRRMVLNIGGIANLTLLIPDRPVRGFDTGPGNMLLDAWIWCKEGKPYDKDARLAGRGRVVIPLLQQMLNDPFFTAPAPKSTGREYFNLGWLAQHLTQFPDLSVADVQSTLLELTATTITRQVLLGGGCERLLVCGGGSRNPLLMTRLADLLPGIKVCRTDDIGINGQDVEALAFAWLAWRTLHDLPGNLPSVTGARETTVLGAIYPANRAHYRS